MPTPPVHLIRPEVRAERAYLVPTTTDAAAKLDQNESPFDLPDDVKRAVLDRFAAEPWNRYPDDRPHALTAALAERLGVEPAAVLVGRGSNEIAHTLGLCFLEAGVPVVLPDPMFALYAGVARMHGARIVRVAPEADLTHDADRILAAAREAKAPLTIVTTPNNPTGRTLPHDGLERLAAGVPGVLVIDEAYHEFVTGPTALDLLGAHPNVLVMRTFSKAMGAAGLRIGYLVGHPDLVAELEKARLPFLVDRFSEAVALEILARPDLVAERVAVLTAEREALHVWLASRDEVEVLPAAANFLLFRTPLPVPDLRDALAARSVRVRDVSGYADLAARDGRPGWARVSVGTPDENAAFRSALAATLEAAHIGR
jgi:histidinol-phosphate aminotransferase